MGWTLKRRHGGGGQKKNSVSGGAQKDGAEATLESARANSVQKGWVSSTEIETTRLRAPRGGQAHPRGVCGRAGMSLGRRRPRRSGRAGKIAPAATETPPRVPAHQTTGRDYRRGGLSAAARSGTSTHLNGVVARTSTHRERGARDHRVAQTGEKSGKPVGRRPFGSVTRKLENMWKTNGAQDDGRLMTPGRAGGGKGGKRGRGGGLPHKTSNGTSESTGRRGQTKKSPSRGATKAARTT